MCIIVGQQPKDSILSSTVDALYNAYQSILVMLFFSSEYGYLLIQFCTV